MSTRVWPYPDLRNGTTFMHSTDAHFGNANLAYENRVAMLYDDFEQLKVATFGYIVSGDQIDWGGSGESPEDALWLAFEAEVERRTGFKPLKVFGNHDALNFTDGSWRTSAQWAEAMGMPTANTVMDIGDLRFIGVSPEKWLPDSFAPDPAVDFVLSDATLDWLDAQLRATRRPCVIVTHVTPIEYDTTVPYPIKPETKFAEIIASNLNVVAHNSGHYHRTINNVNTAKSVTIGGRNILVVNGPALGGRMAGVDFNSYNYASPSASLFITMLDEKTWDVRTRLHTDRRWAPTAGGLYVERITIP